MFKLQLPIPTDNLPDVLLVPNDNDNLTLLGCGLGHTTISTLFYWNYVMYDVYALFVEDHEELKEYIAAVSGLWQLKVLANIGDDYLDRLRVKLNPHDDINDFTPIEFATEVSKLFSHHPISLETDTILNYSSSLLGNRNYFHLSHFDSRNVPVEVQNLPLRNLMFSFATVYITAAMCDAITSGLSRIPTYGQTEQENIVIHLSKLLKEIRDNSHKMDTMLEDLAVSIEHTLKSRRQDSAHHMRKKLGLRVI